MLLTSKHLHFLNHSDEINQICEPLKENFGITSFIYQKNLLDGSEIRLTNQPKWTQYFLEHQFYAISGFEKHPSFYHDGHIVWRNLTNHQPILEKCREHNIDHGITFIKKIPEGCEFYFLGTTPNRPELTNLFLNHIDLLERFILYFKEKSAPIVRKLQQHRIIIPNKYQLVKSEEKAITVLNQAISQKFLRQTQIKKMIVDAQTVISGRELDCARLLIQGKTARQIGAELFLSPRTVETHINHLKDKFNLRSKSELINKLLSLSI